MSLVNDLWQNDVDELRRLRAEVAALKRRVRQYAKALRIARALTGWAELSYVDEKIRAALRKPLPAKPRAKGRR